MKGFNMYRQMTFIGCWSAFFFLLTIEACRGDLSFLASVGNSVTVADIGGQLAAPNLDNAWDADKLREQRQNGIFNSAKQNNQGNGLSSASSSKSAMRTLSSSGNDAGETENSDASFMSYLPVIVAIGAIGMTMVAAGLAQWWRRRGLRNNWLFPTVQEDMPSSLPIPLIAKKPRESMQDNITGKHAQHRAA